MKKCKYCDLYSDGKCKRVKDEICMLVFAILFFIDLGMLSIVASMFK